MKITAFTTACALALTLAACGSGANDNETREAAMEDAMRDAGFDGDVEISDDGETESVTITRGGNTVGQNLDLPDGFPADVPVSPDWNIIHTTPGPMDGFIVQAMTPDDTDTVVAGLRAALTSEGWEEVAFATPSPQMTSVNFEKDGRMANFNVIDGGAQRTVQMTTMTKP